MNQYNNSAKIFTGSTGGELRISLNNTRQVINATNNRAQYYAELAEKYKNEAKEHRDNAQYYAEQNSDVTFEYIDSVKVGLENQIATKQESGDYALKSEIPTKVSELNNDLEFTTFNAVIPDQVGHENKVLCTDGENLFWNTNSSYNLFDVKLLDYVLSFEESKGWASQGTYVYKEAITGSRYGYPDFYNKVVEEFNEATTTEEVNGITVKVHSNGHKFYDVADKDSIDSFYNSIGSAWFYGVDIENERIFLPRDNDFEIEGMLTTNEEKYLYICVGNTTNYEGVTDVVNQGMEILEQVNQGIESRVKLDGSNAEFPYIVDIYVNGTSGYNVWSNGYCEQWGRSGNSANLVTVTLLIPYKNANYNITTANNPVDSRVSYSNEVPYVNNVTVNGFKVWTLNSSYAKGSYWRTCGYIA